MKRPKWFWLLAGALFAAASIAINYEVKIGMHQRTGTVQQPENRTSFPATSVLPIVLPTT
jgi:hypothetical protein